MAPGLSLEKNSIAYSSLPEEIFGKPSPLQQFFEMIRKDYGPQLADSTDFYGNVYLNWHRKKEQKKAGNKRLRMSRKWRKDHNMLKLPRTVWDYQQLQKMHVMWTSYMHDIFQDFQKVPEVEASSQYSSFHSILTKCDLVGALVTVTKSRVPSCIDVAGIIVLETKQTFQVVTPQNQLKILLKEPSVFQFQWRNMEFTAYGRTLLSRAHERAIKKVKSSIDLDF